MSVELKLEPTTVKTFEGLHLYQLFQLRNDEDIWIKVAEQFAVKINSVAFSGKEFSTQLEVVSLLPQRRETTPNFTTNTDEQILETILLSLETLPLEKASEKLRNTLLGTIINVLLKARQSL